MLEQDAKPEEEIAFLINYITNSSQQLIIGIKSANSHNPRRGLRKIWQTLFETFSKIKLNSFPPISNKEVHRLFDLSDVLGEILSLKRDEQYDPLLAFYVGLIPL